MDVTRLLAADELATGVHAFIHGLEGRPELNGVRVTIAGWVKDKQRWRCKRRDNGELLGVKADNLQRETDGKLPAQIFDAVTANDLDIVRAWLGSAGDVDAAVAAQQPNAGWTLLMCACHLGRVDCAAELLGRDADANARSHDGATALLVSLEHASIVHLLLEHRAHTHLRWVGPEAGKGDGASGLTPGTALENAEKLGLGAVAALLREHERVNPPLTAQRDVFELEAETLMHVLAAGLLAEQACMDEFKADERSRWTQERIRSAFADPADTAALSRRFARHGDARLDLEYWTRVAKAEIAFLSRRPRFKAISEKVGDELPGFYEHLQLMSTSAMTPSSFL